MSNDEWMTPPELFQKLNAEFRFTLDVAAIRLQRSFLGCEIDFQTFSSATKNIRKAKTQANLESFL